jgi:hypothetical protein
LATGGVFVVVIVTITGALSRNPLLTMSCAMYLPGTSALNTGVATLGLDKAARLFAGFIMSDHLNVSGNPWGSVPDPLRLTIAPCATVWSGPALAVGGSRALVVIMTVDAGLLKNWSLTINCQTKVPGASTKNVGFTAAGLLSEAVVTLLPGGALTRLHE